MSLRSLNEIHAFEDDDIAYLWCPRFHAKRFETTRTSTSVCRYIVCLLKAPIDKCRAPSRLIARRTGLGCPKKPHNHWIPPDWPPHRVRYPLCTEIASAYR